MARTFIQARKEILDTLAANGWTLSDAHLKVPHATSPSGRYRLWFKAQAVYATRVGVPRPGAGDSFAVVHNFKDARTLSYSLDIRKASAVEFVTWIAKVYPDSGQTLPVAPSPYTTTAPLVQKPKPPRPKYESVAKLNRPYFKQVRWPDPTDEEFDRAQKDIGFMNERELRAVLNEHGVYYHPSDSLSVLRTVARENLDEKFPVTVIPRSEADPRQVRWAAAGKKRHAKSPSRKRRHREMRTLKREGWLPASKAKDYNPDRYDFHWNASQTMFQPRRLLWWDDASYIRYQSEDYGGMDGGKRRHAKAKGRRSVGKPGGHKGRRESYNQGAPVGWNIFPSARARGGSGWFAGNPHTNNADGPFGNRVDALKHARKQEEAYRASVDVRRLLRK